jgi:hypothetical protein
MSGICLLMALTVALLCVAGTAVLENVNMDAESKAEQWRDLMFREVKLVCFGRYALEIPRDAELAWGSASFPSDISVVKDGPGVLESLINAHVDALRLQSSSAEVVYSGVGKSPGSWEIRYFENKFAKRDDALFASFYIAKGGLIFLLSGAKEPPETNASFAKRSYQRIDDLIVREEDVTPTAAGYCVDRGFLTADYYNDQETVSVGFYLPQYPDVTFSISSNKDAYGDYPKEEFEHRLRNQLSLLSRIKAAQDQQGIRYPSREVLREGKRSVQHWKGEESLIRRTDGTHDFEWAFVGTPEDVANPAEFNVQMYTKVAENTVGAAAKASLTDKEAVALWDKLLSGVKFRVKVPGAPEGSYYFLPGQKIDKGTMP